MLKRSDPAATEPEGLTSLVAKARDEAKAWGLAEVALYRTIATEKAKEASVPAALLAAALFLAHAALLALVATLFVALAQVMKPAFAGLLTVVVLAASAAVLAKVALAKLKGGKA